MDRGAWWAAVHRVRKNWTRLKGLSTCVFGFPSGSVVKNPPANTGDLGSIPGSGRSPGERNGYPLQYSCLENSMDRGTWQATVHGVTRVGHN